MIKHMNVKNTLLMLFSATLSTTVSAYDMTADAVNWQQVPKVEKTLFFPGMLTFDWINSPAHKGTFKSDFQVKQKPQKIRTDTFLKPH